MIEAYFAVFTNDTQVQSILAQLIVAHLTEEEVEQFVIGRSSKRRRIDAPSGNQSTLDALFGAGTGRALD